MLAILLQTSGQCMSDINECRINNTCQPASYFWGIIGQIEHLNRNVYWWSQFQRYMPGENIINESIGMLFVSWYWIR